MTKENDDLRTELNALRMWADEFRWKVIASSIFVLLGALGERIWD